jgi:exonuclease VII small subunit
MTMSSENEETVNVHAETLLYEIEGDDLHVGTSDFRIAEVSEQPREVVPTVIVKMESGISKEIALDRLKRIVAEIEANGLPEENAVMPQNRAMKLIDLQVTVEAISKDLELEVLKKLSPGAFAQALALFEEEESDPED